MERWDELFAILRKGPLTARQVAASVQRTIQQGKWDKSQRAALNALEQELEATLTKWRAEDWETRSE